jgi:hypothetical protein
MQTQDVWFALKKLLGRYFAVNQFNRLDNMNCTTM